MKLARAQAATAPDIDEMQAEAMAENVRGTRPTSEGPSKAALQRMAVLNEVAQAEQFAAMEREMDEAAPPATRSIAQQAAAPDADAMREIMAPVLEAAKEHAEFKKEVNTRVSKADRGGRDMGTARDDGGADYRIAKGDTLTAIAKRFNVPLADLARANGITRGTMNFIRAGDMLIIPGKQNDPVADTPSEALQPAPIKAAAQDVPRGESILAEKIRAANQPQSFGDRLRALTEGFSNNPDNVATAETAANYVGAAAALNPFARAMQGLRGLAAGRGAAPIAQRVDPNMARMQAFRQRAPQRVEPSLREMDRMAPKNLGGRQEPDMNYLMQLFQRRQGR